MTLDDQLSALMPKAVDAFSRTAIEGARHAVTDTANPLRLNFFCTAMRILFEHMIGVLAPIDQVTKSEWFVAERPDNLPTRSQRIVFAIQGGLADSFVKETLGIDVMPLRKRLIRAVDDLSKHVHGREDTVIEDEAEQNTAAQATIETLQYLPGYLS
jgi:Predicted pPIWI-associating nuclease